MNLNLATVALGAWQGLGLNRPLTDLQISNLSFISLPSNLLGSDALFRTPWMA